jgi:putative membrane protein
MRFLLRVLASAAALAVATAVVPGIELQTASLGSRILTLIGVALIFGVVNAVLKPIVKTVGCFFYVLTLGLIGLVVNGLLLWLTSWVAGKLHLPFHVTGFWPAFWGAIIVSLVSWLLGILVRDPDKTEPWQGNSPA